MFLQPLGIMADALFTIIAFYTQYEINRSQTLLSFFCIPAVLRECILNAGPSI